MQSQPPGREQILDGSIATQVRFLWAPPWPSVRVPEPFLVA